MEHKNVVGHDGRVHEGLFNAHTGFLIRLNCGQSRYEVVEPYEQLDPARIVEAPLSCGWCQQVTAAGPMAHLSIENVTRGHAVAVLSQADCAGRVPALDNEGLRLALAAVDPVRAPSRELYDLIREHLVEALTERALTKPEGVPEVLVAYRRYTGGTVQAPIGCGNMLMRNGVASGFWTIVEVAAIEQQPGGVLVGLREPDGRVYQWAARDVGRRFFKLDRTRPAENS